MAQSIFDATLDPNNDVKVNNFDWSHANNLTTQIGRVTPVFCDLVPAKTSFRVNPRFGLQFMPMVFPIQTRMKARISWFRYPVRALWKDYTDFVGNFREGLEEPYINFNTQDRLNRMASTGSLGDYLGMPTTLVGNYGNRMNFVPISCSADSHSKFFAYTSKFKSFTDISGFRTEVTSKPAISLYVNRSACQLLSTSGVGHQVQILSLDLTCPRYSSDARGHLEFTGNIPTSYAGSSVICSVVNGFIKNVVNVDSLFTFSVADLLKGLDEGTHFSVYLFTVIPQTSDNNLPTFSAGYIPIVSDGSVSDITLATSPWYNSLSPNKDKQQKILAYGFRAYEGIYNAYIRDNRNNPYYLNGQVQYNKWIPNDAGGLDNELYELRYANWEKDFLTTAVQSPQQGNAPLVGITTYTQTVVNEDGTNTELVKTALVDEDGKKYGLSFKTSSEGLEGVEYLELDNGTKVRQARSLYDLSTSGISIPDLRMVNCYQKFLELNMRKGYSYKDIVEGRFDVKVRYADLLMPEFFGGVSRDIDVNSVTQTVDQSLVSGSGDYASALGSQSGIAGVRGEANANIECFCDEESIIMGILIVTPLPVYTQLLPKHFTYRGLMDHYQPEFNLIGFQPIKYNEVCPIQAYNDNPNSLTDTFGYNRPWYEFAQKYDVAHGLFRTDLSNFLMHRVFDKKPELAQSFLLVDPEQVTDVFSVTATTDKIYGQIWLDITCKLPIARVAIPRLD